MLGLPVDLIAFPDEGLLGYLHRLAEQNGLAGGEVLRLFQAAKDIDLEDGSASPSRNEWLGVAREVHFPVAQPMRMWNIHRRRYCPDCLGEKLYWRAAWSIALVTVCTRHKVRLLDTCPSCGRSLDWRDPRLNCCGGCGARLTAAATDKAEPEAMWLAKELGRRLSGRGDGLSAVSRHLSLESFYDLALCFGARGSQAKSHNAMKIARFGSVENAHPVAMAAARALFHWPRGFHRFVSDMRKRRADQPGWRLAHALGPLYRDFYRRLAPTDYNFVRLAFELYLAEHWDVPLSLKSRFVAAIAVESRRWVSIDVAADQTEMSPATIVRALNSRQIRVRERVDSSGRHVRFVDMVSLRREAARLKTAITLVETAKHLGLPKCRVRQLLDARLLETYGLIRNRNQLWAISSASANRLLGLAPGVAPLPRHSNDLVSLNHLLRYRMRAAPMFVRLIRAVVAREVRVVGVSALPRKMNGWLFRKEEVERLMTDRQGDEGLLSVPDAANELGVKQEVAYALARAGLLKTRQQSLGGRKARFLSRKDLDDFRRRFAFSHELTKVFGGTSKTLSGKLMRRGIKPIAGPKGSDVYCRQYLWRRIHPRTAVGADGQRMRLPLDFH